MDLWKKVTIGLFVGIIFGLYFEQNAIYIKPIGDIFIRLVSMVIVPLIFFAIVTGMSNVSDSKLLGRVGVKAAMAYMLTTTFAIFIGLFVGVVLEPGKGANLALNVNQSTSESLFEKLSSLFVNAVPANALGAMAQGTLLQVVFFSVFTGYVLTKMPKEQSKRIHSFFNVLMAMIFNMVSTVLKLSPYAACALMAWVVGTQGHDVLISLGKLLGCLVLAFFFQYVVFGIMIKAFTRLSPIPFYKKSIAYQAIAFSTSSSKVALPTTIEISKTKLGVSKSSASFILPLGASINMDGMAIYFGLCAVFFAQAIGKVLSPFDYGLIILTSTLGSMGGAGVPGGSITMLPVILGVVGIPIEAVGLLIGIDRIVDMLRTTINITGDAAVTLIVDSTEKQLDRSLYLS